MIPDRFSGSWSLQAPRKVSLLRGACTLLIALGALARLAAAQASGGDRPIDLFEVGAPTFATFSVRDGLPDAVGSVTATDRQGYVWLAPPQGLVRYDGGRWNAVEDPAITDWPIWDLTVDADGVLWAASADRGLARFDGQRWQVENRSSGLPTEHIRRVVETRDHDGHPELWAVSMDGQLLRRRSGHWEVEPGTEPLQHESLLVVAHTHEIGGGDRLWVGTLNSGLWYRDRGGWHRFRPDLADWAQVEGLLVSERDGHEELWIATFGSGLWRLDDSGLRGWTLQTHELPTNDLYGLTQTQLPNGERAIWVASRSGLVRVYHDRAQTFDRGYGLPSNVVRSLSAWRSPDGTEVLWIATEAGVARTVLGSSRWQTASLLGSNGAGVFGVLVEPDGKGGERLWVAATGDGIGLYEGGRWQKFSQATGDLPESDARLVKRVPDARGKPMLLVGMRRGHLLRLREGRRFEEIPTPWEHRAAEAVLDVLGRMVDGHHELWVALRQGGVYRLRDGTWTPFRPAQAITPWSTIKLVEQVDAHGHHWLWVASNQGVGRYDGQRWDLLGNEIGLTDLKLRGLSLLTDARRHAILWAGSTDRGMERIDVTDPLHPVFLPQAGLPPPPSPTTYDAQRDSQGRIYICTNNGVQVLTPAGDHFASQVYRRRDGMLHEECNTNARQIDAHDRFWTGTLGGLTVFDPKFGVPDRQSKPLAITGVTIDGRPVTGDVVVDHQARELRISYAMLSWQRDDESRFRTQLLGYEAEPGPWTAISSRSFSALPPGRYVFRVEGRDYAANFSKPAELALEILPAWWQRGVAQVPFVVAGMLVAYGLVALRTRSLRAQQRHLEEQIAERTGELHAANERLRELSYQDALTGLANRRQLLERLSHPTDLGNETALIFVDVDHFKAYNDRYGHPAGDEALRGIAEVLRSSSPLDAIVARYGGEEFAVLLPDVGRQPALELAEAIRRSAEAFRVPVPGTELINRVSISAGVASARLATPKDAHALLRDADKALYQAKRDGRNCVRALGSEAMT